MKWNEVKDKVHQYDAPIIFSLNIQIVMNKAYKGGIRKRILN